MSTQSNKKNSSRKNLVERRPIPAIVEVSLVLAVLSGGCNPSGAQGSGSAGAGGQVPGGATGLGGGGQGQSAGAATLPTLIAPGKYRVTLGPASGGSGGSATGASGGGSVASGGESAGAAPECTASGGSLPFAAAALVALHAASSSSLPLPGREIGTGRHPAAAGCSTIGVSFVDYASQPPALDLALFSRSGVRGSVLAIGEVNTEFPTPGVAAFPDDTFAVAWTDFDDDELGVQLRKLDPGAATQEPAVVANAAQAFSQFSPDLVFDGQELVVAWVDSSDAVNGPDLRYRTFARDLSPTSPDLTLAATGAAESDVALAALNGAWAAAWRSGASGTETIEVQSGAVHWTVGPFSPGGTGDRPALVFLDAAHLAVAFTKGTDPTTSGTANTPRLFAAVLDAAYPGSALPFPIAPTAEPYASTPTLSQTQPALAGWNNRLLVAWRSSAVPGDAQGDELWSRQVNWSPDANNTLLIDASSTDLPLLGSETLRVGDQSAPTLLSSSLWPEQRMVTAWEDFGKTFGATSGVPDVALQFAQAPTPFTPTDIDIGGPGVAGSETHSLGVFTLNGSGAQITSNFDQFNFAYQQVSGDCTIVARLTDLTNTNVFAQGGVMIRNELTQQSAMAQVKLFVSGGAWFLHRDVTNGFVSGGQLTNPTLFLGQKPWLKVTRRGNTFTGYARADGSPTWVQIGNAVTIPMNTSLYVGLEICSHDDTKLGTATLDNVLISAP